MAPPRPLEAALAAATVVLTSGCLAGLDPGGQAPGDPLDAPITVVVYTNNATVEVEENNSSVESRGVQLIQFPWRADVYAMDNGTRMAVWPLSFDRNTTAVVLIRYSARWAFGGHEGATRVVFLRENEKGTVRAALNASSALYDVGASGPGTFVAVDPLAKVGPEWVTAEYGVAGNLTPYPQIFPPTNGTFVVREHHQIVSRQTAQVVARGPCM